MLESFWSIKLKLTAMLKEVKWNFSIRKYNAKNMKESFYLISNIFVIHFILLLSDSLKFMQFMKNIISKKLIFIPLIILFLLFGFYLSLINGQPEEELFHEKILPKFYYDTAIEIHDSEDRFTGTMAQPQSLITNPSLFPSKVPSFLWSLLKEEYDPFLKFDSNATSFYQSIFENIGYYNGMDVSVPLKESKKLITNFVKEQNFNAKPDLTLTQQLINIFIKKHSFEESSNNIERLKLSKTFFHALKANNGIGFKGWLLLEKPFFLIDGKSYGIKDCAEIFFGQNINDLSEAQQAILIAMYRHPYQINQSLKEQKKAWDAIKRDAIMLVNNSKIIKNHYYIISNIKKIPFPKLPYLPDSLMEIVGQITSKNREQFSSLPTRSDALLKSSKGVVGQELDKLFQAYSISPKSRLITQIAINFDLNDNFYFNHYVEAQMEDLSSSQFWVSVVNEEGKILRLYQKNTVQQPPSQIGNLSKIFSALLFTDRGDTFYTKYCNKKASKEIALEKGYKECSQRAWIDSRRLFSSDKILPMYDGYIKYKEKNNKGDNIYYEPISTKKIEALYQNLALVPLEDNEPQIGIGAGKLEMTPLDMQTSLHKITQLLYNPDQISYGLKLIKSFEYHDIQNSRLNKKINFFSFDSPEQISPMFKNFFTKEKRLTLQSIFKSTIYKNYGSLKWLKNYIRVKFIFAQESHKDSTHWLVGVFKKSGKVYSFTIYLKDKNFSNHEAKRQIRKILELTMKSINNERKMKFEYMKQVFRD